MIRACKILFLCALLQVATAAPAHAISWWWWDDLSGPGFFLGVETEFRLACFGGAQPSPAATAAGQATEAGALRAFKSECLAGRKDQRHLFSVNPVIGYAVASNNSLPYQDARANRRVEVLTAGAALAYAVPGGRGTELRVSTEWNLFYGGAYDSFSRVSFTPAIDVKPFRWGRAENREGNPGWADVVAFRVGAIYYPKGFDATDFGALPGSFHTDHELLTSISLVLDFGKLR
jgi:hypothetical protein